MSFIERVSPPQAIQALGLLAALAGVIIWSSLLLTPAESHAPPAALQPLAALVDNPALQWFSDQAAPVSMKVSGILAGRRGAVAIISLNDGPPRSFLAGERLSQGVRLVAVESDGVVIERDGERSRLTIDTLPDLPFLPVLTRQP